MLKHLTVCTVAFMTIQACSPTETIRSARPLSGHIIIAGDSTAADYPTERAPQIGWGQVLGYYLKPDVTIDNRAVNGRSTKSFRDEGKWSALLETVNAGDLVFISFGHNDSRDDSPERFAAADGAYRQNMARFARGVQARGGIPVIVSSPARRLWEGPAMVETHGLYRLNAGIAAQDADAAFIDLSQLSLDYFEALGTAETKRDFLWLSKNATHQRFPSGIEDNTHFTELGACALARLIALELVSILKEAETLMQNERFDDAVADKAGRSADVYACADRAWD